MAKIAMIGAGNLVFCKTLMEDFLGTPALAGSEYRLMALTYRRLYTMKGFVERMIKTRCPLKPRSWAREARSTVPISSRPR
jgi:alpha-galactosidase/6-phospho-beta-glucosidase family protein